jgi:dTDP-4-amino-4,6-dideoxygalactose transaminase
MPWKVPLFETCFGPEELEAVQQPLRDQWITMGEVTIRFEEAFAKRCGVKHAIAVNNCTAALHLAVLAAGIKAGDEVICPTLTFVATANAIRYVGATPVFCDPVGPENLNIGPTQIENLITEKTRGIMVVHYAGFPCDMVTIQDLATRHDLVIIEDCAHALFSTLHGRSCGSWGTVAGFSFFGNKNMTCGEGGMVTTNDDQVAECVRNMRSHGMTTLTLDRYKGRAFTYDVIAHGYNYRMDEMRSAMALVQLNRLDGFLRERSRIRERYCQQLKGSQILIPTFDWESISQQGDTVGYHIMPILLPSGCKREAISNRLKEDGIQSSVHYRPIHTFSVFSRKHEVPLHLRKSEDIADRELTLPMFPTMTNEQVDLVCKSLLNSVTTYSNSLSSWKITYVASSTE